MSSITSSLVQPSNREGAENEVLRWRSWPLVDHRHWSWVVPVGVLAVGLGAAYFSVRWLAGLTVVVVLAAALWQIFIPTTYELHAHGFRRHVLGRTRIVPWHAVRSYRTLSTGVVLYQRPDPTAVDSLRSLYLPYPPDEDEMLCAIREHLGHAVELS